MTEKWATLPDFPGYKISDQGRVLSEKRAAPRILPQHMNRHGEMRPAGGPRVQKSMYISRLVMLAFVGPRPEGHEIRHLNGRRTDSRLANLAYGTPSENRLDTVAHGNHPWANKTHCPSGHEYTEENVRRTPGRPNARYCRACHAARSKGSAA